MRDVENVLADGITRWKESETQTSLTTEQPTVLWQAQELGVEGKHMYSEIRKAHAKGWRMWVSWRVRRGKENWLGGEMNEWEMVAERTEFMAYHCAERKNKGTTVAGKLVAANVYH